ncbi:MAG: hypothetical protein PVF54_03780 [Anaerolineae bacterium]|jgi:hypothetical protein
MSAAEERLRVLQMLEDGKITPEEAAALLRALGKGQGAGPRVVGPDTENRYLRIRVTDLASGTGKVNVTIPLGLVSAGLRIAERFAPDFEGVDMEGLEKAIISGAEGKIIEVMDAEDNERVEIYVE